jgi:RNA 3'-terminal phosphate cyclase (ATP)
MATNQLILLDGSHGEGGGQILRTSLGLSMLTGRPFRIEKIRENREKPGLMRQHLAAVNAAASVCSANVVGAAIGSRELEFCPGLVKPGEYTFATGSAGSTTLVLQTLLPALITANGQSTIKLEGGTHNPFAPPVDFLEHAFLPQLSRMGVEISISLDRVGFYPAGGGRFTAHIAPASKLRPLHLPSRGQTLRREARALVAALPGVIAKRELQRVEKMLGWAGDELQIRQLTDDRGPGNVLMLLYQCEQVTEVFTGFGARGVTAEAVAEAAIQETRRYLAAGDAAVGEHLADQLMIPLAMAGGGSFTTMPLSQHATTNIQTIQRFLDVKFTIEEASRHVSRVTLAT